MIKWLKRCAIALVLLMTLAGGVVVAYDMWGDGPNAQRALDAGNAAEAIRLYDKALTHHFWTSSYRAEMLAIRGDAKIQLRNFGGALADFNEAVKLDPNVPWFYSRRAKTHLLRKEFQPAADDVDTALKLLPDNLPLLEQRAHIAGAMHDYKKAALGYHAIRQIDPQDARAYLREAYYLASLGETEKAIAAATEMPVKSYDVESYITKAGIIDVIGAHDRALQDYEQAIRLSPNKADIYGKRADAYFDAGDTELAFNDYAHALNLKPDYAKAWYGRGRTYYLLGNYIAARSDLLQAGKIDPQLPYQMIWLHLTNVRLGVDDRKNLTDTLASTQAKDWPRPILEYYAGQRDRASIQKSATADAVPELSFEQTCEANYYTGALYLAQGERTKALPLLHEAATNCPLGFVELSAAKFELKALGE